MELKRVVVTGLGALTPIGNTTQEFWDGLLNWMSGTGPITGFDTEKFKTKFACKLKNINPEDHMDKKEASQLDPFVQYALVATAEAVKYGGYDWEKIDTNRVGVIWGSVCLLYTSRCV